MTYFRKQFDSYHIVYDQEGAVINCAYGGQPTGRIFFVRTDASLPRNFITNEHDPARSQIHLYFPMSKFNDIINIIRNEKPLELHFDMDNKIGELATAD